FLKRRSACRQPSETQPQSKNSPPSILLLNKRCSGCSRTSISNKRSSPAATKAWRFFRVFASLWQKAALNPPGRHEDAKLFTVGLCAKRGCERGSKSFSPCELLAAVEPEPPL